MYMRQIEPHSSLRRVFDIGADPAKFFVSGSRPPAATVA